ncbi:hypothetical protein GTP46_02550 [Duganella sp. FT135W]|uniref:Uncharacterized protein n=1 Tax=Duganella flavida TaxID=2692175 RepID=A0A6L8K3P7_9BURK|nr:hypothetical protein [Duganella flavida]MYM21525.1 hypothetical protein [Duganella flavida]
MDEKQKFASTEKSIAQAYAAYIVALATRKHGPDKPEISDTKLQGTWQANAIEQKRLNKPG